MLGITQSTGYLTYRHEPFLFGWPTETWHGISRGCFTAPHLSQYSERLERISQLYSSTIGLFSTGTTMAYSLSTLGLAFIAVLAIYVITQRILDYARVKHIPGPFWQDGLICG